MIRSDKSMFLNLFFFILFRLFPNCLPQNFNTTDVLYICLSTVCVSVLYTQKECFLPPYEPIFTLCGAILPFEDSYGNYKKQAGKNQTQTKQNK